MEIFSFLIILAAVLTGAYCLFKDKKSLLYLFSLVIISLVFVNFAWYLSIFFLPLLFLPFFKTIRFGTLISFCLLPAIALAHFALMLFQTVSLPSLPWLAVIFVTLLTALGILGIFENKLVRYLLLSNLIQLTFVLLDLSVASATGKLAILGTIQIFNYTLAGLLFFLTLGILTKGGKISSIDKLEGYFYSDKLNATGSIIAGLSMVGLPGLNIFVAEYYLFVASFAISPLISIMGIFAALILFIMYFKIPYVLLVGREMPKTLCPGVLKGVTLGLALLCILFGLLPQLQIFILTVIF